VSAAALDSSGNEDPTPAASTFAVGGAADSTAPTLDVTAPAQRNATHPLPTVTIAGDVADEVGVTEVKIAIQDTATKKWWNGSGWGGFVNLNATVAAPGTAATTWSFDFTPPGPGRYGYQAFATDGTGNTSAKTVWRTVTLG
jgi:hypothetical protein